MNEIEEKFYKAFTTFVESAPTVSVFDNYGDKVSEVKVMKRDMGCLTDNLYFDLEIKDFSTNNYPTIHPIFVLDPRQNMNKSKGYMPDFKIEHIGSYNKSVTSSSFSIEIDGHEWHEKTKEQAAADKRRERAFLKDKTIPVRFTGSEIYHSASDCVKEVIEILTAFEIDNARANEEGGNA